MASSKRKYPRCVVKGCPGNVSVGLSFHRLPHNDVSAWCHNLRIHPSEITSKKLVCDLHFEESCISSSKLRKGARPTLNLGHSTDILPSLPLYSQPNYCCILDCDVKCPPSKLHSFPVDEDRHEEWLSVCVFKINFIKHKSKFICNRHFDPSMISDDGSLKEGAIPKMKPNEFLYCNSKQTEQNSVLKTRTRQKQDESSLNSFPGCHSDDREFLSDSESDLSDCMECKAVCHCCSQLSKVNELFRERCDRLERLLKEQEDKIEKLKQENDQLEMRLNAKSLSMQINM